MKILIATKNRGKFEEIYEMLRGFNAEFVSLTDLKITQDFPEHGESFEQNALGKARFYYALSSLPTIADDSGIFVEALGDELGLKTRRWGAGEEASDEGWLEYFMKRMAQEKNRNAKFVCAAAFVSGKEEQIFLGETEGTISEKVEVPVKPGIPLSSVFRPLEHEKVFAALSAAEKNVLSHRGKAFQKLLDYLKSESSSSSSLSPSSTRTWIVLSEE